MKQLVAVIFSCFFVYGCSFAVARKIDENKMHCKVCNGTKFVPSRKISKFVIVNEQPIFKTGSYYKCTECGLISNVRVPQIK